LLQQTRFNFNENNENNYGNGKSDPRADPTRPDGSGRDQCPSLVYTLINNSKLIDATSRLPIDG